MVYFVDKSSPTDWHSPGFVATYDISTRTVTSALSRYFYQNNLRDTPESTSPHMRKTKFCHGVRDNNFKDTVRMHNNWSIPKSWVLFGHNQAEELVEHWAAKRMRVLDMWKRMSDCVSLEYEAALADFHKQRGRIREKLNERRWSWEKEDRGDDDGFCT